MNRKFLTAALLTCAVLLCFAFADLNGTWTGNVKMADGTEFPLTYVFKVDGEKLGGTIASPQGDLPIYDGKLTNGGKDFSFKVDVGGAPVPNVGKYYGDSVTVIADLNGEKLHSTLKRVAK